MSLLRDGKTVENKTATIYGINDNRISHAFEFEDVKDKLHLELTSFQEHILEELVKNDGFIPIVIGGGRACGKSWINEYLFDALNGESSRIIFDEFLDSLESKTVSVEFDFREKKERTISDIKKEIKYERNPLRLKQLNKELNMKYKELKSGRK